MEALEGCDNLRVLELGYNPFGEEGIKAIADVMKYKLQVRFPGSCDDIRICLGSGNNRKAVNA